MGAIVTATGTRRLGSVDLLRGLVMVVMALDHVRDYFSSARFDPTDLTRTSAALFLTRFVTHLCAPVFVFLAGSSAFLSLTRGRSRGALARFLLVRGLWLVVLELTVVRFGWFFDLDYRLTMGQVIWAIGWSMVVLAPLVWLPPELVGILGLLVVAGHGLFDGVHASDAGRLGWLWAVLHSGEPIEPWPGYRFLPVYPLLPWMGVMAAGYGFGPLLTWPEPRRARALAGLGVLLTLVFFALRGVNGYGDPKPWIAESSPLFTALSFVNCEKYPPSLDFLLMTLGPAIAALGLLPALAARGARPLVTFGRVPLFYYLIHIPFIHLLAMLVALARYGVEAMAIDEMNLPAGYGYGLGVVYGVWVLVVLSLYPLCRWYEQVKARHPDSLLRYL